jgi:hypothetical protein
MAEGDARWWRDNQSNTLREKAMRAQATGANAVLALVRRSGTENIKARDSPQESLNDHGQVRDEVCLPSTTSTLLGFYTE